MRQKMQKKERVQKPKLGEAKRARKRVRGAFQGRRTSRFAGIYIYNYICIYTCTIPSLPNTCSGLFVGVRSFVPIPPRCLEAKGNVWAGGFAGIQSPCQKMIGLYNHLLSKVYRFHNHCQKVIGFLGVECCHTSHMPRRLLQKSIRFIRIHTALNFIHAKKLMKPQEPSLWKA